MAAQTTRVRVRVSGIVQGVGFRPYVAGLAADLGLDGFVGNDTMGVFIEAEGPAGAITAFVDRLPAEAPPLAVIEGVETRRIAAVGQRGFVIAASAGNGARDVLISPDVATCADCLEEVLDPGDRRHRYAFTNCTNCGPRFTIIRDVPYDRPSTTMAGFVMCDDCRREYHDPADRRFHAQPICCPACGPRLRLFSGHGGAQIDGDPVIETSRLLRGGAVVAVKGLGGYHLAVDATDEGAAAALRSRKHREDKPFAVLVRDLEAASSLCEVSGGEADLLTSRAAPIVLLRRRRGARVAAAVAPGNRWLGLMLPSTGLHHVLASEHGAPLVLTSGNTSDEPIAYRDEDAFARLAGIADAFLTHDRPIHVRVDDSVARVVAGRPVPIRRSRGYVPHPLALPWAFPRHVLACGAELKSAVCVAKARHAFVSHHLGDLENYETFVSFTEAIAHLCRLFDIAPAVVAYDLHPEYLSTKHALEMDGVDLVGVQHHHAHIASCLADNGEAGPVIGVAFDGTGYGADGTLWGGEILAADLEGFERLAHLEPVALPGGATAIREPWRMAAAYLDVALGPQLPELDVVLRNRERFGQVIAVARAGGVHAPMTSSAGRLFDAAAAILGVRDAVSYEGQAAIELEQHADPAHAGTYPVAVTEERPWRIQGADLVRAIVADLQAGVAAPVIAARFHGGVSDAIGDCCERARAATGLGTVALSGGVFQNVLLTERTVGALQRRGLRVLTHNRVPPNDGGISLGQAVVAAARERSRPTAVSSRRTW
ncbi:carbamoyltransferase HypF [soil metagenome]